MSYVVNNEILPTHCTTESTSILSEIGDLYEEAVYDEQVKYREWTYYVDKSIESLQAVKRKNIRNCENDWKLWGIKLLRFDRHALSFLEEVKSVEIKGSGVGRGVLVVLNCYQKLVLRDHHRLLYRQESRPMSYFVPFHYF